MPINLGNVRRLEEEKKKVLQEQNNLNVSTNSLPKATTLTNNNSERTWFKSGAFSDGYQVGDITKTVLGTAGDIGTGLLKGVVRAGEGIGDLLAYGGAQIVDWLGNEEYANQVRQNASKDLTGKLFSGIDNVIEPNSVLGEKSQNVVSSIGQMYASAVTSSKVLGSKGNIGLNIGGKKFNIPTTSVISGASSSMGEAYQKGAEDWQAWLTGAGGGFAEGLSESLFGTFGLGGSALDDAIVKGVTQNMKSGLAKSMAKAGIKATGEGVEEVVSYLLDYGSKQAIDYGKKTFNLSGPDLAEKFNSEELWENFFSGTLAAAIGGIPSTISEVRGSTPNFNVNEGYKRSLLPNIQDSNTNSTNNFSSMRYSLNENNINAPIANSDGNLVNPNRYQYIKSENVRIDNLRKSASQYFNNSQETRNFMSTIENIILDKDYNVVFDNTLQSKNGNSVNAQITTNKNGEVEIKINSNSNRAGEFLLVHEITHAIETDNMKKLVLDYASKNSEFNQALESLKQTYGTNDVNSEVLADISGQLLGNQEFINNLSMEQPNIFRRIYNKIIELVNKITGNSHEAWFIRDLRNKWENAYRIQNNNNLNTTKYHVSENFSNEIDQVLNGTYKSNNQVKARDYTPQILVENGVSDLPMLITAKHIKSTIYSFDEAQKLGLPTDNVNYHALGKERLLNVIDSLDDPLEIYKTSKDNYLVITEILDDNGRNIVVPIKIDGKGTYNDVYIDENQIKSAYGRNNLERYIKNNNFEKIYTKKGTTLNEGVQYPNIGNSIDNNITNSQENVKLSSTKYSMQEARSDVYNLQEIQQNIEDIDRQISENVNALQKIENEHWDEWIRYRNDLESKNRTITAETRNQFFSESYAEHKKIIDNIDTLVNKKVKLINSEKSSISMENAREVSRIEEEHTFYDKDLKDALENIEYDDKFAINKAQALVEFDNLVKNEKLEISFSPYSFSVYAHQKGETIDWGYKPLNSYRLSDHWNFESRGETHDKLTGVNQYTQEVIIGKFNGETYDIVKRFNQSSTNTQENIKLPPTKYSMQEKKNDTSQESEIPLSQRVSGDKLLDTLDFIDEIKSVGAEVDDNGYVTVYHQTTDENAQKIMQTGEMISRELDIFFSTSPNAQQSDGRGTTKLEFKIPAEKLILDDIFDDNADVKISLNGKKKLDVSDYLVARSQFSQNNPTWQDFLEENYPARGTRTNMQNIKIPTMQDIQRMENSNINLSNPNRVQNPLEISRLTPEDASTTPPLPNVRRNRVNDGNSSFASNIQNKTNMLNEEQKGTILSDEEIRYYDKITNKESLEKAFEKLNNNGRHETESWFAKDSENATATDVAEGWILLKQYADNNDSDGMVAVAKKLRDIGTKAGQTVQAFNIMARMTPEGMVKYAQSELMEAYDRMVKGKTQKWIDKYQKDFDLTPQEVGAIMETMQKVSTMEDGYNKIEELAKIQKIITDKLPPARGAGIKSWMRISMLFNAKTQVRNVAGNAIIAPVNAFSDLFASMADKVVGAKTGYRTTGILNVPNYVKGFKKGAYQSYNDFRKGINTRNIQGNRFEINEGKSFNNNTPIGKALNRVDSLLSFMLDAGDRTFYEATFTNSINNQLVLNNTTEVTQEMIDIATQEALSRTWQDNNNYTKFVLQTRNALNKINIKGYGLGDVLIPFAKTPANLTKAIVDYSPAGVVTTLIKGKNLKNAIETGQFTPQMQHDFVQSLGKATVGTMLYVAGYALAKAGIVSGESDDDKDVRDFMKNTLGVNSYSIKIGDKSFTYDWAQPIAAPLSIMANIVQKDKEDASTLEKVISSLDTAGNILLEQSFMESINTALSNNDGLATGIEEAILDLPARAVPTFMKQIVDLTDGTQRQTFEYGKPIQSMINSVKAKIPVLSQTLAPSVDTMGREIQRYGGKNNIFNVFLNPANVSTENISESAGEIYRLYKETGNTNIMPRVAPYYINKDRKKIMLNSSQRAQYQKASGNIIETEIEKLLNNSQYNKLTDEKKSEVISDIVNFSYNVAQKEVLGTELSDTYQKVYEYSQIGDVSDYYAFKNSVDDTDKETKKESITNYLLNSTLSDKELAVLYGSYYSSEEKLEDMITLKIPIKEYIKLDSQEFTTDYGSNGKAITNSKKNKIINYVNLLNLSIPQKAILIKSQYSSYDSYNKQIVSYVNSQNLSKFDKATLLKSIGFDNYNSYIVQEVNSRNISAKEKEEILDDLGFRIVNGRVYW